MATYNGWPYVEHQIESILGQLASGDELVIFDDGSTDGTVEFLLGQSDPRVIVFAGMPNVGCVRNFERALTAATGDIVFLADQDDIWAPSKVDRVLGEFGRNSGVAMVHHRFLEFMGESVDGRVGPRRRAGTFRGLGFLFSEWLRPSVFGSCLAVRRAALSRMLPFPAGVYAHDHWAAIVGSKDGVRFIGDCLLRRRVHGKNLTPQGGLSIWKKIRVRALFAWLIAVSLARVGEKKG